MSALTAAFTYRLGRTLLSPRHGLIAVLLLTWCRTGPYQWEARQSGIVLVDFGRYARYDIAVPFFGLIGMMLILPWLLRERPPTPPDADATSAARVRGRVCRHGDGESSDRPDLHRYADRLVPRLVPRCGTRTR